MCKNVEIEQSLPHCFGAIKVTGKVTRRGFTYYFKVYFSIIFKRHFKKVEGHFEQLCISQFVEILLVLLFITF
jgi:23S rRNA U2552 (ribose-2'-O)-methylase RlmE/FtsJ